MRQAQEMPNCQYYDARKHGYVKLKKWKKLPGKMNV